MTTCWIHFLATCWLHGAQEGQPVGVVDWLVSRRYSTPRPIFSYSLVWSPVLGKDLCVEMAKYGLGRPSAQCRWHLYDTRRDLSTGVSSGRGFDPATLREAYESKKNHEQTMAERGELHVDLRLGTTPALL